MKKPSKFLFLNFWLGLFSLTNNIGDDGEPISGNCNWCVQRAGLPAKKGMVRERQLEGYVGGEDKSPAAGGKGVWGRSPQPLKTFVFFT